MAKTPTPAPLPERFFTPEDVSRLLGVPVKTLYQWRSLRQGPPGFRVGRHLRYDPVAVERWVRDLIDGDELAA